MVPNVSGLENQPVRFEEQISKNFSEIIKDVNINYISKIWRAEQIISKQNIQVGQIIIQNKI